MSRLAVDPLHAEMRRVPAAAPGLPEREPGDAVFDACSACGASTRAREVSQVTGRCAPCDDRARGRYRATAYAAAARAGEVVDEDETDDFARYLPAALARRGLRLERDALRWVVRRG